jgi:hypothetical protein
MMVLLPPVVIVLTIAGFAIFIYGDVTRYDGLRYTGVTLVALAGIRLLISVAHDRHR